MTVFEQAGEVGGPRGDAGPKRSFFQSRPSCFVLSGACVQAAARPWRCVHGGRLPSPGESRLLTEHGDTPLPRGLISLLGSGLFSVREKVRLVRLLASLRGLDGHPFDGVPLSEWVRNTIGAGSGANFLLAPFRVSTYADDAGDRGLGGRGRPAQQHHSTNKARGRTGPDQAKVSPQHRALTFLDGADSGGPLHPPAPSQARVSAET